MFIHCRKPVKRNVLRRHPAAYSFGGLDEAQQPAIVGRSNRIEGQIRGMRFMVQEPRLRVDILQHLCAAEAALTWISVAVLTFQVERCVPAGVARGEPERSRRFLDRRHLDRFAK